jgi:hypothetical protein
MGATSLSGELEDESEYPARSARREAKSELAQVRAHRGFCDIATGPERVNALKSIRCTWDWLDEVIE